MELKSNTYNSTKDYIPAFKYNESNDRLHESIDWSIYKPIFTYRSLSLLPLNETVSGLNVFKGQRTESWLSTCFRNAIVYASFVIFFIFFPISACFCIKQVHALERLVVLRLGKLQCIKNSGLVVVLPCIDKWIKVSLRPKEFTITTSQILTADGAIVETSATLRYQICNVMHYVTRLDDPHGILQNLAYHCLKNIISEKHQDDIENNRESVHSSLKSELNSTIIKWGLEISDVLLNPVKVLKAAEPVDVFSSVMAVLKALVDQPKYLPQRHNSFTEAFADTVQLHGKNHLQESETDIQTLDIISSLKHCIEVLVQKGDLKDVQAILKFDIVSNAERTFVCIIDKGTVAVTEGHDYHDVSPNVSVVLSEVDLQKFLNGKLSLMQAYLKGKVAITGNRSILNILGKVFN